MVLFCLGQV